jgi:hypothetical protein
LGLVRFSEARTLLVAAMATPVQTPTTTARTMATMRRIRAAFAGLDAGDMEVDYDKLEALVNCEPYGSLHASWLIHGREEPFMN